jgi:actin-related protein
LTRISKVGFAGFPPPYKFPSVVGRAIKPDPGQKAYVGSEAILYQQDIITQYPIERGIVTNWDDMEKILYTSFYKLRIVPEEHPTLLTEAALNPKTNREKMTQLMFEIFDVPAMYIGVQPVLGLYASGRTVGVVLESGDGVTHSVPIYGGHAIPYAIQKLEIAGRDLSDYLYNMLTEQGHSIADRQTVVDIKEKCSYVTSNFEEQMGNPHGGVNTSYELPNGQVINLGKERFRCAEPLFQPLLLGLESPGIAEMVHKSITNCDVETHSSFYENVVLSGGNTKIFGITERLHQGLLHLAPPNRKVKVIAPPDRAVSAWLGASILGCLPSFSTIWISKEEYDESGSSVIHRMCF